MTSYLAHNVTNVIQPLWWVNAPPLMTGTQVNASLVNAPNAALYPLGLGCRFKPPWRHHWALTYCQPASLRVEGPAAAAFILATACLAQTASPQYLIQGGITLTRPWLSWRCQRSLATKAQHVNALNPSCGSPMMPLRLQRAFLPCNPGPSPLTPWTILSFSWQLRPLTYFLLKSSASQP